MPLLFGFFLIADRAVVVLSWPEAEAVVTDSRIETRGSQHAARIRVRFESPEGPVETEPLHDYRSGTYAWIAETLERFPTGGEAAIRYDPDDPQRARLEAGLNLGTFGLGLLLASAGVVFGGVGALAFRSARLSREAAGAASREAAARAERSEVRTVAFFVLTIGVVMALSGAALLPSAILVRSWPMVTARVERGDVYSRTSSGTGKAGSVTYYVARLYVAYEHEGRAYVATIDAGSSRERRQAERLVASIPRGDPRSIRVNPQRPHRIKPLGSWPLVLPMAFLVSGLMVSAVALWLLRR